ncbi:unnamed protein product [Aureobasidium pullulans]|nr:unnamed protein product [Aureobasidium pullulans]CAD0027595.1 unnamed protein product [Aureobasidium pullulans]
MAWKYVREKTAAIFADQARTGSSKDPPPRFTTAMTTYARKKLSPHIMRFQLLVSSLLAWTAAAAPLQARDIITAQTLISDIKGIDDGVNALTASIKAYDGGLIKELPIGADITAIHIANRKGFLDANLRATPFNAADSTAIVEYTASSVGVDIPASVDVLKAKYDVFESQKVVILAGLKLLKNDHDTFSAALVAKITADKEHGVAAVAVIDDALQSAIDLYSS